jgi:hypothetical protein
MPTAGRGPRRRDPRRSSVDGRQRENSVVATPTAIPSAYRDTWKLPTSWRPPTPTAPIFGRRRRLWPSAPRPIPVVLVRK